MYNAEAVVIYVGKAKNSKTPSSYFQKWQKNTRFSQQYDKIDVTVTHT